MPIVLHRFRDHAVQPDTRLLILGTFNPDIPGGPDFFYGRSKNYLWQLLPAFLDSPTLKKAALPEKRAFMAEHGIDFADLIHSVNVPVSKEKIVLDTYIDTHIYEMKNIPGLIRALPQLEAVYFTRKTFRSVPNIERAMAGIRSYCLKRGIRFCLLETPARFTSQAKQAKWRALVRY